MKRIRNIVARPVRLVALAATLMCGVAFGQDQNDPKNPTPKAPAAQKAAPGTDEPSAAPANRVQPRNNRDNQPGARDGQATAEEKRAAIGAQFEAQGDQGLSVKTIEEGGILGQAGLKQNDRIVSVDGHAFTNARHLEAYIWSQSGRQVPMIIDRQGKQYTIQAMIPMSNIDGGWLGVYLDEGEPNVQGARITQIYPAGPAARAGLQVGDVITQINKQAITGSADAVMTLREFPPQAQVELAVLRDKDPMNVAVILGSRHNSGYQSFYRGNSQQQYGQQHGQQGQGQQGQDPRFAGNDQFNGIPLHAMQMEQDRRNAEQHERIEDEIRLLRAEVQKLRELLEKK